MNAICRLHYVRLVYRTLLFLFLLACYLQKRVKGELLFSWNKGKPALLIITWAVFCFEMIMRLFPSGHESPGSQKQFRQNYIKTGSTRIEIQDNNGTVLTALIWIGFNAVFGVFHLCGMMDDGMLLLLCSFYSVCDMVCILFFCPFQTWIMKNRCCSLCRIYNWDYAMMFTPMVFVHHVYAWSLFALSMIILLRWEITFFLHPERFSQKTNAYLSCANCREKLCAHKKQLKTFWKKRETSAVEREKRLKK